MPYRGRCARSICILYTVQKQGAAVKWNEEMMSVRSFGREGVAASDASFQAILIRPISSKIAYNSFDTFDEQYISHVARPNYYQHAMRYVRFMSLLITILQSMTWLPWGRYLHCLIQGVNTALPAADCSLKITQIT